MEKLQNINSYAQLANWSGRLDKPLLVLLENENFSGLMSEVVEGVAKEFPEALQLIRVRGKEAEVIKTEVSFSKLPALLIFSKSKLVAFYQGLVAKHEIIKFLSKTNTNK